MPVALLHAEVQDGCRSVISFDVVGLPRPQGSKRHVGHGVMVEQSKGLPEWRRVVADAARQHAPDVPLDGPLMLSCSFYFPMPAARRKADREVGTRWKDTAPDLSKLVRAVEDALKAGAVIRDDARICQLNAYKFEVTAWYGVTVNVGTVAS
jgi:Holliday junction resolvase RusA-like endonuclease